MKISANNFLIVSNFVCFTSCLFITSFIWSSLLLRTAIAGNDVLLKDESNDLSHSLPSETSRGVWRAHQRLPVFQLNRIPTKYFRQNDRIQHWLKSHKRQMEEQPPPGFIGVRGRRERQSFIKGKRFPTEDYQTLTEVFPDLYGEAIEAVTDELMDPRLAGKKSDTIVYKDGFLGVRG